MFGRSSGNHAWLAACQSKRLRFLRFSFTQRTQRKRLHLNGNRALVSLCGCRLSQYEDRCHWLKDSKFLRDLESDSVDSDILDEELRSLELHEEKT